MGYKPEIDECPVCGTKWTRTAFGNKVWYDCKPCNDTAENLMKKSSSEYQDLGNGKKEYKLNDLDSWEQFLSDIGTFDEGDDWDGVFLKRTVIEKELIISELLRQGILKNVRDALDFKGHYK